MTGPNLGRVTPGEGGVIQTLADFARTPLYDSGRVVINKVSKRTGATVTVEKPRWTVPAGLVLGLATLWELERLVAEAGVAFGHLEGAALAGLGGVAGTIGGYAERGTRAAAAGSGGFFNWLTSDIARFSIEHQAP